MKTLKLVLVLAALSLASGCATEEFVKKQTDPLAARLTALEAKVAGIENRLDHMPTKAELTDADRALLQEAKDSAAKAAASARQAEAAAQEAQNAAKKSAKLFELEQKK